MLRSCLKRKGWSNSWAEDSKGIVWGWQNRVGSRTEAAGGWQCGGVCRILAPGTGLESECELVDERGSKKQGSCSTGGGTTGTSVLGSRLLRRWAGSFHSLTSNLAHCKKKKIISQNWHVQPQSVLLLLYESFTVCSPTKHIPGLNKYWTSFFCLQKY